MSDQRLQRVLAHLVACSHEPDTSIGDALCATSVDVLDIAGAGIMVHGPAGEPFSLGVSGPDMAAIHELEVALGEGPCLDAFRDGIPLGEADLLHPQTDRWPMFRAEVLRTPARAAFGYPLQFGGGRVGALNLYATEAGALTDEQHLDALVLADVSVHTVLTNVRAGSSDEAVAEVEDLFANQTVVHLATGMVTVQLSVSTSDALARIRARAFAESRPVSAVAADVVSRILRFEP